MLIAWLEPPSATIQGDQIYRTHQPCADLAARAGVWAVYGSLLHPAMRLAAEVADVLVCAQVVDAELLALFAARDRRNLPSIYEINDNFMGPTAVGGAGSFYLAPAQRALTLQLAAAADGLQLSSAALADLYAPYARYQAATFVNAVDAPPPLAPVRTTGRKRLGWGGSASHADDLRAIAPALRQLLNELPTLELAIMGPSAIRAAVDWVPKDRLHYRVDGSLADYRAFLSTLDVGLAPLRATAFNLGRSDVKAVEYASAGAAALVQRARAYTDVLAAQAAESFADNDELVAHARTLLCDDAARQSQRQRAHAYVCTQRTRPRLAAARWAWLAAQVARRGVALEPPEARVRAILRCAPSAHVAGRAVAVPFDTAASHLFNGLLEVQAGRRGDQDFRRGVAARPDDALGHLYLGHHVTCPRQAARALAQARKLAPHALAVSTAAAERALANGDVATVLALWRTRPKACAIHAPLALCAHRALAKGNASLVDQCVPLWLALADAIAHPDLAVALAHCALQQTPVETKRNEDHKQGNARGSGSNRTASLHLLTQAAEAALQRALPHAHPRATLLVLLAQLQRRRGAHRLCLATLAPLTKAAPKATGDAAAPDLLAMAHALAAEAWAKGGHSAMAGRHAALARSLAASATS